MGYGIYNSIKYLLTKSPDPPRSAEALSKGLTYKAWNG